MKRTKSLILTASVALAMAFTFSCSSDDDGDGNGGGGGKGNNIANYRTVPIGTQVWMAENMNHAVGVSHCYDDIPANCDIYGRLYDWPTAKTVCPSGWHLPSKEDWDILMDYVQKDNGSTYNSNSPSGADIAGKYLKATSGWGMSGNSGGEDKYGFAALPGGTRYPSNTTGVFNMDKLQGYWWCADGYVSDNPAGYTWLMSFGSEVALPSAEAADGLCSVRCVKD
jgi:uncharacterized protein (TIGR02145 family)